MKQSQYRQRKVAAALAIVVALLIIFAVPCFSVTEPEYAPKQLMVTLKPGSSSADMQTIAKNNGMTIVKALPVANTYLLKWTRTDSADYKQSKLSLDRRVASANKNYAWRPLATPNDPRFSEQWDMNMINMPKAWDIEKGKDTVTVAVLDTGISLTHPDIVNRLVQGRDVADGDDDPSFPPNAKAEGTAHGLHVAGTIAADTDNGIGVAGICWTGVKIMPVKVFADSGYASESTLVCWDSDVITGLDWAKAHGANVVNMSIGGAGYNSAFQAKVTQLVSGGMVIVAAAGNESGAVDYPAAYDGVIAVSAVGPDGNITNYSNYGPQISVAAPGGAGVNFTMDDPNDILSLWWSAGVDGYASIAGTSMASPHVAGVAAILLSAGVPAADVRSIMELSAQPVGSTRPNNQYGWGIVDCNAALTSGGGTISILEPVNGDKLDSMLPHLSVRCFNIKKNTIRMYIGANVDANNDGIPDDVTGPLIDDTNVDSFYNDGTGMLECQLVERGKTYPITAKNPLPIDAPLAAGTYRICVTGDPSFGVSGEPVTSWSTFKIQPWSQPSGLRLASVPYPLGRDTSKTERACTTDFYGTSGFKMARWLPSVGVYAKLNYAGVINDIRGSLYPPDLDAHPHSMTDATPPAGMGFWLDMAAPTPLLANGFVDRLDAYDIPLVAGWNMIGDPFPFKVDWNAAMVTYQGNTLTIADAVAAGWIRPSLYRYSSNGYSYDSLPAGTLIPWEGNWVRCLKGTASAPVVLSIPPVVSQIVTTQSIHSTGFQLISSDRSPSRSNWSMKLTAEAGAARAQDNTIGVRAKSVDGYDPADVEAPPSPTGFVQLSFTHPDWGGNSGHYSTDFRSAVRSQKVWSFDVTTDLANTDVRIAWPEIGSVPEDYLVTLVDCSSLRHVSLRATDSYEYNSGSAVSPRHFKLFVRPLRDTRVALNTAALDCIGRQVARR